MQGQQFPTDEQIIRAKIEAKELQVRHLIACQEALEQRARVLLSRLTALRNYIDGAKSYLAYNLKLLTMEASYGHPGNETSREKPDIEYIVAPDGTRVAAFSVDSGIPPAEGQG